MREPRLSRNLADGESTLIEQHPRPLQPALNNESMHGHTHCLMECRFQMRYAQTGSLSDLIERKIRTEIVLNIGEHLAKSVTTQRFVTG